MIRTTTTYFFLFVFVLLFAACYDKQREQQLVQREQALLEKEKQFALKETEYQALIKMRDSLLTRRMADSGKKNGMVNVNWPPEIAGLWNGKVVCTESSCSDYVAGDVRTDVWEFGSDSSQLVAKVINNNKLIRVYTAVYNNNQARLHFKTDAAIDKQVEMNILLNEISAAKIKGLRILTIDDKCTAKFSVELSRAPNKD